MVLFHSKMFLIFDPRIQDYQMKRTHIWSCLLWMSVHVNVYQPHLATVPCAQPWREFQGSRERLPHPSPSYLGNFHSKSFRKAFALHFQGFVPETAFSTKLCQIIQWCLGFQSSDKKNCQDTLVRRLESGDVLGPRMRVQPGRNLQRNQPQRSKENQTKQGHQLNSCYVFATRFKFRFKKTFQALRFWNC